MNELNRAFIKAYAKQQPEPSAGPAEQGPRPSRVGAVGAAAPSPSGRQRSLADAWHRIDPAEAGASMPPGTAGPHRRARAAGNGEPMPATPSRPTTAAESRQEKAPIGDPWNQAPLIIMPAFAEGISGTAEAASAAWWALPEPIHASPDRAEETGLEARPTIRQEDHVADESWPQPAQPPAGRRLTPVWEVDRLAWPEICLRLERSAGFDGRDTGARLVAACHQGLHVLAVASARRQEGRTTLAFCLARSAAAAGMRVGLMDADFGNPQVAQRLGLNLSCGWQDILDGRLDLDEIAVSSLSDHLVLLPLAESQRNWPAEKWGAGARRAVQEAAARLDLLILDLDPDQAHASMLLDPDNCPIDAAIVVRDVRRTTWAETVSVGRRLHHGGVAAIGIAENFDASAAAA